MSARAPKKISEEGRETARGARGEDALTRRARKLEESIPRKLPPWSPAPTSWPNKIWGATLVVGSIVYAATHRSDRFAWKGAAILSGIIVAVALIAIVARRRALRALRQGRVVVGVVKDVASYLGKSPRVVLTIRYALDGERVAKISAPTSADEDRWSDVAELKAGARVLLAVDPARPSAPQILDVE